MVNYIYLFLSNSKKTRILNAFLHFVRVAQFQGRIFYTQKTTLGRNVFLRKEPNSNPASPNLNLLLYFRERPPLWKSKIKIHPYCGWYFIFGHIPNNTGNAQVRRVLACQPCICYRLPVNGRIYSASLREGGGEHSEPEGAGGIIAYHSPQKKHFSFIHAGSSHRYRGPPSFRRRAFSLKHPTLTFCSFSIHRHRLFSTTRLSRGFRFTKRAARTVALAAVLCVFASAFEPLFYFKKPFTMCSSASFSVNPKVISLMSCSPAILPMAAS